MDLALLHELGAAARVEKRGVKRGSTRLETTGVESREADGHVTGLEYGLHGKDTFGTDAVRAVDTDFYGLRIAGSEQRLQGSSVLLEIFADGRHGGGRLLVGAQNRPMHLRRSDDTEVVYAASCGGDARGN